MPNPHIEVIRNALQAYGNAPALMHLEELEKELAPRLTREIIRAKDCSAEMWDALLLHWQDVDELQENTSEAQRLADQYIRFHHQHSKLLKQLADHILGGIA